MLGGKNTSPGEDQTPDLCMFDTAYKYNALTSCATGEMLTERATKWYVHVYTFAKKKQNIFSTCGIRMLLYIGF